jgi:hypothetical protein
MPLHNFYNDSIVIHRGDRVVRCEVSFQGKKILGPLDLDVEEDDLLIRESTNERFIVTSVERHKAPRHMSSRMSHCELTVVYEKQARKQQEEAARSQVTWNIGSAGNVAGRDISGVAIAIGQLTLKEVLEMTIQRVTEDASIPDSEKKHLIERIQGFLNNPYVSGLATTAIWELMKSGLGF